jgi:aldehyde dehydrogenase (NAD+)
VTPKLLQPGGSGTAGYVAGEWITSGELIRNFNPSDLSDDLGAYGVASKDDLLRAAIAAKEAQPSWSRTPMAQRAELLFSIANVLAANRRELGETLAREEGKLLSEALGEANRAAQLFRYYAGEVVRDVSYRYASLRSDVEIDVSNIPLGVVGLITPWNFPLSVPAWKIAPALAFGNAVVFKPSEITPASAVVLTQLMGEAGLPAGVFNLVLGAGDVGRSLVDCPLVDGISFTGSSAVGRAVALSAVGRGAKVQVELGGKNPLIVMGDADLERAVTAAGNSAFAQTGQRCTAGSRVICVDSIHDEFAKRLATTARSLKVGHAFDPASDLGPVVDARQLAKNLSYVEIGVQEGAQLVCGGSEVTGLPTSGYYFTPTVFTDVTNDMRVAQEEIFGPIAAVIKVGDLDQAISVANDTPYALSASIFTRSQANVREFLGRIDAGMTMVNLPTAGVDYHVPFGGVKGSSYGPREQGQAAREFYTFSRTTYSSTAVE